MIERVWTIALNTYREAIRARILHGLLGLAVATLGYALIVSAYTLNNQVRAVTNIGTASISVYGIVVAILLGATSLYRELELKTIFPVLARPIHRAEYLVGKFLGTVLVLVAFVTINAALLLVALCAVEGESLWLPAGSLLGAGAAFGGCFAFRRSWLTWLPLPFGLVFLAFGYFVTRDLAAARSTIVWSALLTVLEVGIVSAATLVFASFSSPFLTAVFTLGVVIVGRSADTLARLPEKMFGSGIHDIGVAASRVLPNLMVYVPPRRLLAGEIPTVSVGQYLAQAAVQSLAWCALLLTVAALLFRRRDFL